MPAGEPTRLRFRRVSSSSFPGPVVLAPIQSAKACSEVSRANIDTNRLLPARWSPLLRFHLIYCLARSGFVSAGRFPLSDETAAAQRSAISGEMVALLRARAQEHPERIAVHDGDRAVTYRELLEQVRSKAAILAGHPQARIGLLLPNNPDFVTWFFAVLWSGHAALPLPTTVPPAGLAPLLVDAGVETIVSTQRLAPALHGLRALPLPVQPPLHN